MIKFSLEYLERQCIKFLKLGLMGVSIIVAAADCVPAGQGCQCISPETGEEGKDINCSNFNPKIPAYYPYITVVGGTALPVGAALGVPEVAWQLNVTYLNSSFLRTSRDGFSNTFRALP